MTTTHTLQRRLIQSIQGTKPQTGSATSIETAQNDDEMTQSASGIPKAAISGPWLVANPAAIPGAFASVTETLQREEPEEAGPNPPVRWRVRVRSVLRSDTPPPARAARLAVAAG
jgi:hypothetical protein